MDSDVQPSYIAIARIARTRGNRGEVLADLYTDFPDRFDALEEVWLEFADGRLQHMSLEDTWEHKGRIVLKFLGVDSISSAEGCVGSWVVVPVDQAVATSGRYILRSRPRWMLGSRYPGAPAGHGE